jgi:hypothetical protein
MRQGYTEAINMEKNLARLPPDGTDMVGPVKVLPDLFCMALSLSLVLLRMVKTTSDVGVCCDG